MNIDLEMASQVFQMAEKVDTAYLCGSQAKGTATEKSDVDFAILANDKMSLMEEMQLQAALAEALSFDAIDMVNLRSASTKLQFNLVSTGKLIFERDVDHTDTYVENLMRTYHANAYRYRIFQQDLESGFREDYGG